MESIRVIINFVNNLLWSKNILVVMLIGTAVYFTFKTKFMQFRLFGDIVRILKGNGDEKRDGVSSLETFFLGTACRVGAGNISGVVAAVSIGGPGALFWMWLVALLGASTSFVESSLAVMYRTKIKNGEYQGGTPWIIKKRLNMKWLGAVYVGISYNIFQYYFFRSGVTYFISGYEHLYHSIRMTIIQIDRCTIVSAFVYF